MKHSNRNLAQYRKTGSSKFYHLCHFSFLFLKISKARFEITMCNCNFSRIVSFLYKGLVFQEAKRNDSQRTSHNTAALSSRSMRSFGSFFFLRHPLIPIVECLDKRNCVSLIQLSSNYANIARICRMAPNIRRWNCISFTQRAECTRKRRVDYRFFCGRISRFALQPVYTPYTSHVHFIRAARRASVKLLALRPRCMCFAILASTFVLLTASDVSSKIGN